jgi:hypothetical protein
MGRSLVRADPLRAIVGAKENTCTKPESIALAQAVAALASKGRTGARNCMLAEAAPWPDTRARAKKCLRATWETPRSQAGVVVCLLCVTNEVLSDKGIFAVAHNDRHTYEIQAVDLASSEIREHGPPTVVAVLQAVGRSWRRHGRLCPPLSLPRLRRRIPRRSTVVAVVATLFA